jgi:hypothetical protein
VDDVTTYVLDTVVAAPPEDVRGDERALEVWARAIALPFLVRGRSGEHMVQITASSEASLAGAVCEFRIKVDVSCDISA